MPLYYTRHGSKNDPNTLIVYEYISKLDDEQLCQADESLGFYTFNFKGTPTPDFISEASFIERFREAVVEPIIKFQRLATAYLDRKHFEEMAHARRPSLLVNGLPSVSEDGSSNNASGPAGERGAARLNMLRRMRAPPFQYAWTFYHDKHSDTTSYEGRLTVMEESIISVKTFWQVLNNYPLERLSMKDSVHFFKRGVKPVWEDPRNVKGGSWTFRVPKDKSQRFWTELLVLAVGEQFADVIQPKDDLCGLSLSVRFNSNLITIWNRDGSAQKSIDGILTVVLNSLEPDLRPKEGSYYYKKHSEHASYNEVVAKAQAEAVAAKERDGDGKIEEAKVREEEKEKLEREADEEEKALEGGTSGASGPA